MWNLIKEIEKSIYSYPKAYWESDNSKLDEEWINWDTIIFAKLHDVCLRTTWWLSEYDPVTKNAFGCVVNNWNMNWWSIPVYELEDLKVCGLGRVCFVENFKPIKLRYLEISPF